MGNYVKEYFFSLTGLKCYWLVTNYCRVAGTYRYLFGPGIPSDLFKLCVVLTVFHCLMKMREAIPIEKLVF